MAKYHRGQEKEHSIKAQLYEEAIENDCSETTIIGEKQE